MHMNIFRPKGTMKSEYRSSSAERLRANAVALVGAAILTVLNVGASVPAPEKILPDDTLVVFTVPDFGKLRDIYQASPQRQLWNDPAMKPFKEKFVSKWKTEFVRPLEQK